MPSSPTATPTDTPTGAPAPPPPQGRGGGAILLGAVLVGAGTLWLLAALGVDLPVAVVTPVLLVLLGIVVVVSGVRGWDNAVVGVAVFVGVWVAIAAVVTALVDVPLSGAMGDREHAPATVAEAEEGHGLFAGTQVIDLRELETGGEVAELRASTVLGQVEVLVPEGMAVRIDATVAGGAITVFDEVVDGIGLDRQVEHGSWETATQRVDLEIHVGLGEVIVHRR